MFRTRLLSGIVLMAIAIAALMYGGYVLFGLITVISVIGLYELYRTVNMEKSLPAAAGYISSVVLDILLLNRASLLTDTTENVVKYAQYHEYIIMWIVFTLIVFMALYVIAYPRYHANQITMLLFGLIYVTVMLSFVFRLRYVENGILFVWLIFIGAWGSDTCAYCVGKLFGKHKMPSELSPNKTIEGCAGGVVGAALIGFLFALVFFDNRSYWWQFAVIGGVSSVISQIGDLAASAIKRNHGIKDYGQLIPGHGGILDRFDSIIFIAPIVYYFVIFFRL